MKNSSKELIKNARPEIILRFNGRGCETKRGKIRMLRVKCLGVVERAQQTYLIVKTHANQPIIGLKLSVGSGTIIAET